MIIEDDKNPRKLPLDYKSIAEERHINEYGDTGTDMGAYSSGMMNPGVSTFASPQASQNPNAFAGNHPSMFYPVGTNKVDMYNSYKVTGPSDEDIAKLKKTVTPDEIMCGMDYELKAMFIKNKSLAKEIVVAKLKKDPVYYSQLHMMGIGGTEEQLEEGNNPKLPTELIKAAKEWIKDCQWGDLDSDDVDELSDVEVENGVNRHYDGGIKQFIKDSEPVTIKENMININDDLKVSVPAVQVIIDEMLAKRKPTVPVNNKEMADAVKDSVDKREKKRLLGQDSWFKKML